MAWIRLDDAFPRHRRIRHLRRDVVAKWLHVVALCYCGEHLTDGFVDELALEQIIGDADVAKATAKRCIPKLLDAGLWVEHPDGFVIRDFLDYNPTAATVKEKRDAARERMSKLRRSREQEANFPRSSQPPSLTHEEQRPSALGAVIDQSLQSVA